MFKLLLSLSLGLFLLPMGVLAESDSDHYEKEKYEDDGYSPVIYDGIDFAAKYEEGKVRMEWSALNPPNGEALQWYKVMRSEANNNPVYPDQGAIAVLGNDQDTAFNDYPDRGAFYRVCGITDTNGRYCSNVVWVEVEKIDKKYEYHYDRKIEEKHEADKEAYEERKREQAEKRQADKERYEAEKREAWEKKKQAHQEELKARKAEFEAKRKAAQEKFEKKVKDKKVHQSGELSASLIERLDSWLERLGQRLEKSQLTDSVKVDKVESIQQKLYAWEKGSERRTLIVDYLDETLNEWIAQYRESDGVEDLDSLLEGLFD